MESTELRHEYKHTINIHDYYVLRQRLQAVAQRDPNANADGRYHVRSLYFDNDDNRALREKIDGLADREKFRVRIYNGRSDLIRLEKKSKRGSLGNKISADLTREQAGRIIAGDTDWMRGSGDALLLELYGKMRFQCLKPKTIVDYRREAYIYPAGDVRVTFDTDVRSGLYTTGLFDQDFPTFPVMENGLLLLEIKYDRFLPDLIRDVVQTNVRRTESYSKYAACRVYE